MNIKSHQSSSPQSRQRLPSWLQGPLNSIRCQRVAGIIETEEQAEKIRDYRMARLKKLAPAIHTVLDACIDVHGGCRKPGCPNCARLFRLWRSAETERLISRNNGHSEQSIITIIIREVVAGELCEVDLKSELAKLRVNLSRSVSTQLPLVGGVEVAWRQGKWSLHIHAVAFGPARKLRPKLAKPFVGRAKRPVKVQKLKHRKQVTYAGKFQDTWYPSTSKRWSQCVPLPDNLMVELQEWWDRYTLRDFVFLHGFRISGGKIAPNHQNGKRAKALRPGGLPTLRRLKANPLLPRIKARSHGPTHPRA